MLQLLAGLLPVGVSVAWMPLRHDLPNTDLALVLVVVIAGVGFAGGRLAVLVGATGAGVSFDLLHTPPYGHLAITHARDVLTTAFLVVAGVAMGELAYRLGRYRQRAESQADAFASVTTAAGVVATGGEAGLVVEAVLSELTTRFSLRACSYVPGPPAGDVAFVGRDGTICRLQGSSPTTSVEEVVDLPVWASGEVVGSFRMTLASSADVLNPSQRQLAISLADQAGAALTAAGVPREGTEPGTAPPPDENPRRRGLRLVRS